MPRHAAITNGIVVEDSGGSFLARIRTPSGSLLTSGGTSQITYKLYDMDDDDTLVDSGTLVPSTVITALQTGNGWYQDDTGYNFRHDFAFGPVNVDQEHAYRMEHKITPTAGAAFYILWNVQVLPVIGS